MKIKSRLGIVLAVALLGMLSSVSNAQVADRDRVPGVSDITGQLARIQPPSFIFEGSIEDDFRGFLFLEMENLTLNRNITLTGDRTGSFTSANSLTQGTVARGMEINSYFLFYDPTGRFVSLPGVSGTIIFQQDILGVIVQRSQLEASNSTLRARGTTYRDFVGVNFIDETIRISSDRRSFTFQFRNNSQYKQVRIITMATGVESGSGSGDDDDTNDGNAPNARGESATTTEGRAVTIDVLENDTDNNDNIRTASLRVTDRPDNGSTTVSTSAGTVRYTPDNGFTGTDRFTYEICDTTDLCDTAQVTITVEAADSGDDDGNGNGSGSGSGNGNGDSGGDLSLRTLLPEADDCSFTDEARIDIVPGNRENIIRLDDEKGLTPVAILSSEDFPAPNCVDVSTITFGPNGDEAGAISCGVVNVNFDRWIDVLCDFITVDLDFSIDDDEGRLLADTIDNGNVDATDDVMVFLNGMTGDRDDDDSGALIDGDNMLSGTLLDASNDCSAVDEARIDIVPGNRENIIRLDDQTGMTPVAILSTERFPAPNCVELDSITFGPTGVEQPAVSCGVVNVNFDRWPDMVCDFITADLDFMTDDMTGELRADTIENDSITEIDDVMVLNERRPPNFVPPGGNSALAVKAQQFGSTLVLIAQGAEVERLEIEVFSASGRSIYADRSEGKLLRWNMKSQAGQTLANGVYITLVTALDTDGNVVGRSIKKIAIVR